MEENAKNANNVMNTAWKIAKPYLLADNMSSEMWDEFINVSQAKWEEINKTDSALANLYSRFIIGLQEYRGVIDEKY